MTVLVQDHFYSDILNLHVTSQATEKLWRCECCQAHLDYSWGFVLQDRWALSAWHDWTARPAILHGSIRLDQCCELEVALWLPFVCAARVCVFGAPSLLVLWCIDHSHTNTRVAECMVANSSSWRRFCLWITLDCNTFNVLLWRLWLVLM